MTDDDYKSFLKKLHRNLDLYQEREAWIAALEFGQNPFDEVTREALRDE